MKRVYLAFDQGICDDGVELFLSCLSKMERLSLRDCNISPQLKTKMTEKGKEKKCSVDIHSPGKQEQTLSKNAEA